MTSSATVARNYPLEGCLGFVCKRCANKQSPKPYTETCNMCQLAEMHGSSMSKALAVLGELHPESVKSGKAGCAATIKGEKKCERCVESDCKRLGSLACRGKFWSHDRREVTAAIYAARPPLKRRTGSGKNGTGSRNAYLF